MKKLNNKGFTVVELVVSFVLLSILVVGMLGIVLQFRTEAYLSNRKLDLTRYKDTVTKAIQKDIIKYGVQDISYCKDASNNTITSCVVLTFKNSTTKNLQVSNFDVHNRYILYGGQKFPIEEVVKRENAVIGDATIHLPDNSSINLKTRAVGTSNIYKIEIPIVADDIAQDFGIFIVASNDDRINPAYE